MAPAVSIDNAKCVLVIGATSGIGRALALAISELPTRPTVIAAGRRQDRLKELGEKKLETLQLDVTADIETLKKAVDELLAEYPNLDAVIFAAGVQNQQDFTKDVDLKAHIKEINLNYIAISCLMTMFIPHFLKLSAEGRPSFIMPITTGLAFMPSSYVPNYSASKAALRSLTTSIRAQLAATKVNVVEIIPPLVESELHNAYEPHIAEALAKLAMPLDEYIKKTIDGLRKGNIHVAVGTADILLKRFEKEGLNGPVPMKLD
ncbi:hypothetical protein MVEN_01801000 [Mycena venus]|uniref:NAD(P)-binding protein n=1 Tax=Mycena venus TaxID=2733690 RepID=A0A8H6XK51_9AGAR|nr:hypothetical protein MVEN_01801000 [Mycena venus]